ncbi:hypothetical protein [Chitinophaga caseinilytica]|uniref:hypothetical protein n=1 Tax=Chitinophaga caseinilytica TaxID=2267521 RepID=UPI003C2C0E00
MDAASLIGSIPQLPPTVTAMHELFTLQTKYGEEFRTGALLDPPLGQCKQLVSAIHDATIRDIMKKSPRRDMPDSIQYEDERWKLALRPVLGPEVKARLAGLDAAARPVVTQIFELQAAFDWVNYYHEDEKIKKVFRQKEAAISSENAPGAARAKVELGKSLYEKQQQLWMDRFRKYTTALKTLQQLMEKIDYGEKLSAADQKLAGKILGDVQARALEAHEKLVWNQTSIVMNGELTFSGFQILSMYGE